MIVQAFVLLSLISVTVIAITQPCNETYVAENGHQCLPCANGYHKVSDFVIDGTQSECMLCMNGTYMPSCDTAPKCITCRLDCPDKRHVQVKTCTGVSDIECKCIIGYFWKPSVIGPNHGECRPHQKCKEGHGVVAMGTPSSDTECVPCENGFTYSNSLSFESCVPCSSCNTFIETQCTAFNNTVCKEQQPKPQNERSSDGLEPETIVGIVIAVVAVIAVLIVILVIRRCRKDIEGEKPENAERGLGNDYSPSHVDTTNTGPGCSFSLSRDTTTNHNTNDEKATPASGERQNDPAKNGTDSFIINQAFDPDSEDNLEMEKSKGQDEVIFQLKTGNSSSKQSQSSCAYTKEIKRTLENKNDENPNELSSNQSDCCSIHSKESCRNKGMKLSYSNKGFTDDKDSLSNDTDLTVDASAVAPRTLPPEVDEERNSNHPKEAGFDGMERCDDGPLNSLGQYREGMQSQRTSIENDSVDPEREVIGPAASSDNMTAGKVLNRTEENHHLTIWYEMFDFLQCNMRFQDFKIFARRLACNTNKDFFETIDVKIENSGEGNTPPNERIYQILTSWRQATPNAQLNDILDALKHCNLNALCIKLIDKLKDKNLLDADIDGDFLDTVTARSGNDNSLSPGNDLSVQDADIYIEDNDLAYGGHVVMEDLKSFKYEDDDAGCIS